MYGQSLKDFWDIDDYPPIPHYEAGVLKSELASSIQINMLIDYSIVDISNYAVEFFHINNTRELMWTHDVDSRYFTFPEQFFLTKHRKRKHAIRKMSTTNVGSVIDSLLLHPNAHQHIESPISYHKIRIGGGILNPFVFLFHLRYQLCPDSPARSSERIRLISLFESAIRKNTPVTANALFSRT